jgi:hypothetical protein
MTARERFHAVMNFQPFDRLPILEWASWWNETIRRWHAEGLPATLKDRYEICRYFGLDLYWQDWLSARKQSCPAPASHGAPLIESLADYEALRPHLFPSPDQLAARWPAWERAAKEDAVLWFTLEGFFWFPRTLLGIEPHLYAFYDQPELLHRINSDLADWHLQIIERIGNIAQPDFMTFAEDLSYNNGPMLSQAQFEEFLTPYYRRVIPALRKLGVIPLVDSDGDILKPAAWFEAAGLEGILPLERQAGVDIAQLRAAYPKLKFIGHFDKLTMNQGEVVMRAEFERLLPTAARGGFLISCDHQTPPGVSLEDYRLYLRLFREYAARANISPSLCPP